MIKNSTNINKANNHLSDHKKGGQRRMVLEMQVLAWNRHKKVAGLHR